MQAEAKVFNLCAFPWIKLLELRYTRLFAQVQFEAIERSEYALIWSFGCDEEVDPKGNQGDTWRE